VERKKQEGNNEDNSEGREHKKKGTVENMGVQKWELMK
jgi:hypothetical protein